jgi:hypothetical protein
MALKGEWGLIIIYYKKTDKGQGTGKGIKGQCLKKRRRLAATTIKVII